MYLIFTEDDGWHTSQLIKSFEKNKKKIKNAKIHNSLVNIEDFTKIIKEFKEYFFKGF